MKKDLVKAFKLLPYGLSVKSTVVLFVLFLVLGIVQTVLAPIGINGSYFNTGAVFIFAAMMFPGQLLLSGDVASFVQTSPYKKKIQVQMQTNLELVASLVGITIIVIIYGVHMAMRPENTVELMKGLLFSGMAMLFIETINTLLYKYFILSLIVIYVLTFTYMMLPIAGIRTMNGPVITYIANTPALAIVVCYVLGIIGAVGNYLVSSLFYKKEFSKMAYAAALKRN